MAIFCRFSALDDLKPRDWKDYNKVKEAALKAGRFSCFEVNTPTQCSQITRLCKDPEIVIDNKSVSYPWTLVRKRLSVSDFTSLEQSL